MIELISLNADSSLINI